LRYCRRLEIDFPSLPLVRQGIERFYPLERAVLEASYKP
jgi:hypothetical protein